MDRKVTGIVGYLTLIGWLVAYLAGDREGARFHLNQALVLNLASVALNIVGFITGWIPLVGWLVGLVLGLANFVLFIFWVMGLVYAVQEQETPLPVIGGIQLLH